MSLRVGVVLEGFCGGWFGRDSYEDKRVEALGYDWCVAREIDTGVVRFATTGGLSGSIDEYLNIFVAGDPA